MSSVIPNPVESLCRAIRNGDGNQVQQLLDHGVDVNAYDSVGDLAIDVAWRLKKYDLIELLLNHDSRFPSDFNDSLTDSLRAVASERQELHHAVGKGDIAQVQAFLNRRPHLRLWLNADNESLCHCAVRKNRIQTYAFLASRRCEFRNEEERSCLYHLTPVQSCHLRRKQHEYLQGCGATHLAYLQIRTKYPRRDKEHESEVRVLYAKLNAFRFMGTILKVIETSTHFTIYFDRGRSNLGYAEDRSVVNLSSHTLVIRGPRSSTKTMGILAYHLCFLSLHIVYRNFGKPYADDEKDPERARRYRDILSRVRQRQHQLHPILRGVFQNNAGEEVISRVPQMLIEYEGDGADNDSKKGVTFLMEQIAELLEFFTDDVLSDLESYVKQHDGNLEAERIQSENTRLGQVARVEDISLAMESAFNVADFPKNWLLLATSVNLTVAEVTVYAAVKFTGRPFLFLETSQWNHSVQEVLTQNACSFVLLTCKPTDGDHIREILNFLSHLSEVTDATIVLTADSHQRTYLEESVKASSFFSSRYATINCSDKNAHMIPEPRTESLLKSTTISFQGTQEVPLQDVIDSFSLSQVIDTNMLEDIAAGGNTISIGSPLAKFEEAEYFVERKFERHIRLEKLTSVPSDVFAFLGCTEETVTEILPPGTGAHCFQDLEEFEKFVLVVGSNEYEELIKLTIYENKVVHLVERVDDNVFLWRTSNGPTSRLRKCVSASNAVGCSELAILLESREKAAVVCGAPGLGKSTIASHLASEMKKINQRAWVFCVNLPERTVPMNTHASSNIFQKLSALCGIEEGGLPYALFKESLEWSRPFEVVVILDALDEIGQDCRSDVLRLCVDLKKTCTFKLIVLSRNVWKRLLEDTFGTIAFDMVPFDRQDQMTFLKRYWQRRAPNEVAEEHVASFAKSILDCFPVSYSMGSMHSLAEIPLLLRLVAEIEEKMVLSGKAPDELYFKKLTILDIYVKYFQHKYRMCKARWKSEHADQDKTDGKVEQRRAFFEDMSLHALKSTLHDEQLLNVFAKTKTPPHPLSEEAEVIPKGDKERDLVGGEDIDLPVFEHKTVAEFLTASWLFCKMKPTSSMQSKVRDTILSLYKVTDYQMIRYFLDSFAVSRYPFHVAVMDSDIGYIRKHLAPDSIDAFDDLGRTPLHVAALYADEHIVSRIAHECSWEATKITDTFGFTPMMYADRFRAWAKLSSMCTSRTVLDSHTAVNMRAALHNANSEKRLEMSVFCHAVVKELVDFLRLLLSHFRGRLDDIKDKEKRTLLFYVNTSTTLSILCPHSDSYKSCDVNAQDVEGCSPLHHAASTNKLDVVTGLCLEGADVSAKNHKGETPLSVAARCGFFDVMSYLISFGADVNALDAKLNTALHAACQYGHRKCVRLLLDSGINTTQRNVWGLAAIELLSDDDAKALDLLIYAGERRSRETSKKVSLTVPENGYRRRHSSDSEAKHPTLGGRASAELASNSNLHTMILSGNLDVHKIDRLIQRQNDLNTTNCYGETALLLACARGCDVFVQRLLEYNASANISDRDGRLPLHAAARNGQHSAKTYNLLIEHSKDVNSVDRQGKSALVIACEHGRSDAVQCLLESNADANITERRGRLPLHQAAKHGKLPTDCLHVLARHTVDINATDSKGETALHLAIEARHNHVVTCLLEENARANIPDKTGKLALHRAVCANVEENTFGLIISRTDDINHRDIDARTALHEAVWSRNPTAIIMLLRAGAQANVKDRFGCLPLHNACESDLTDRYCFLALIENTDDFNEYDDTGFTPLMYACYERNSKPIQWLLEHGAQVNDRGRPFNLLSVAYQSSLSEDDLLLIIDRLDDVNKKVHMSRTALFNACQSGHLKTVRYLLSKGADVNVADEDGRTPLHQSALKGHADIVKLLLPHAEAHARDKYDRTSCDLARKKGYMNIVHAIEALWGKSPPGSALVAHE
ncbi:uncharacterized protein LOC135366391 [Ornithodoros turicata]|uniref:uncharacterized protein LOC135366391 n=1 Tax=Ornithodoros turicata TaxID=34597 RepID=UPI00313A42C1